MAEKQEVYICSCGRSHVFYYDHTEKYVRHKEYDDEDEGEISSSSIFDVSSSDE